jgi:hypothetical protein
LRQAVQDGWSDDASSLLADECADKPACDGPEAPPWCEMPLPSNQTAQNTIRFCPSEGSMDGNSMGGNMRNAVWLAPHMRKCSWHNGGSLMLASSKADTLEQGNRTTGFKYTLLLPASQNTRGRPSSVTLSRRPPDV